MILMWCFTLPPNVYLSSSHDLNVVLHTSTECVRPGDWSYVASWMCQTIYITNTLGLKYAQFHFCQAQSSPVPAMLHTVPRLGFRHVTPGENFWGRKLLHFFCFVAIRERFLRKIWGMGFFGAVKVSNLQNCIFTNSQKFSPSKLYRYTVPG